MNNRTNDYLKFYGEHHISPVQQDISEMEVHYKRREKLYRQLGMPRILFEHKDVCEIGPGSGYNSLVLFANGWNVNHLDLVEANARGIEDMKKLFEKNGIDKSRYTINNSTIENYETLKKYDVVIAEGFLQYLSNQKEVINKIISITKQGGVMVVTCADDMCFYIEQMKRLIAHVLTRKIEDFDKKVAILTEIFAPQLNSLKGVSRSSEDWVKDQLLNPASVNDNSLSMIEAVEFFDGEADYLGSSPRMFTDYSWYKDIWFDDIASYREQFTKKNVNLILANMKDEIRISGSEVERLKDIVKNSKKLCREFENSKDMQLIHDIFDCHMQVKEILNHQSSELSDIMSQIAFALQDILDNEDSFDFQKYPNFFAAFGRTLQYISFIKK